MLALDRPSVRRGAAALVLLPVAAVAARAQAPGRPGAETSAEAGADAGVATWTGSDVVRIDLDSVPLAAIGSLSELLQGRVAGVLVRPTSGLAGASPEVRLRGRRAWLRSEAPLLVVDGVRVAGGRTAGASDSTFVTSRLDELPVEQVAVVEVWRGAAAAARFGPGAADGAIVVTTRRGRVGRPRVQAYADAGLASDPGAGRPTYWGRVGRSLDGGAPCLEWASPIGRCVDVRPTSWGASDDAGWRTAPRGRVGLRADGGAARARWAIGGDLAQTGGTIAGSAEARRSLGVRTDLQPLARWRLALDAGVVGGTLDAPLDGLTDRISDFVPPMVAATGARRTSAYAQRLARTDVAVRNRWALTSALEAFADAGWSESRRRDRGARIIRAAGTSPGSTSEARGEARDQVTSIEAGATARWRLGRAALVSTLRLQSLVDRERRERETAFSEADTPGSRFVTSVLQLDARTSARAVAVDQTLAAGPLAVSAAVRLDRMELPLSGRERALPTGRLGATLRLWRDGARSVTLRASAGEATARLAEADALSAVLASAVVVPSPFFPVPAAPARPPVERTREGELGLDAVLGPRVHVRVTAYDQRTRDAFIPVVLPPPYQGTSRRYDFFGSRTTGVEATADLALVERPGGALALRLVGWAGRSRIAELAGPPLVLRAGASGIADEWVAEGKPIGGYAARTVPIPTVSAGASPSAVFAAVQSVIQSPYARVAGTPTPTRTLAAELRGRVGARLTLSAVAELQGGAVGSPDPAVRRQGTRAFVDPTAPAQEQVRDRVLAFAPEYALARTDFLRLREVAATWRLAGGSGRRPASTLTLAARNALTVTGYRGADPEVGSTRAGASAGFNDLPVPRTLVLRVTSGW